MSRAAAAPLSLLDGQREVLESLARSCTAEALAKIPNLTVDTATAWRDFYQAAGGSRGAETAKARVGLMNDIIRTLGGTA